MHQARPLIVVIIVAAIAFTAGHAWTLNRASARAATPSAAQAPKPPATQLADPHAEALTWAGTPGRNHQYLQPAIGSFKAVVRFRTRDGGDWTDLNGAVEREWTLDKRFLRETLTAKTASGDDFQALRIIGFDVLDGLYQSARMDSLSTSINIDTGSFDVNTHSLTLNGQFRDPLSKRIYRTRLIFDLANRDRQTCNGFAVDEDGNEYKSYEAVFERVAK